MARVRELNNFNSFREIRIPKLNAAEADALVVLIDQIAGWRNLNATSKADKVRFISQACEGSLPGFLLRLLKSDYVKKKYQEEYNKSEGLQKFEKRAIIAALYIAHAGYDAPIDLLSNALHFDAGRMLDRLSGQNDALKLICRQGEYVRAVPAIGATNILEHMIPDKEIVDSILSILEHLAQNTYHDDFERHLFGQMMRYSIMRSVVTDENQVNRFFDHVSKIEYFRRQVLFWLQWHMAKSDFKEFYDAEKFLEQGYCEAESLEKRAGTKYNRRQLDDRKAKFLMRRAQHVERQPAELFRDLKEAWEIVGRLLRNEGATRHPFQTLQAIAETFSSQSQRLLDFQRDTAHQAIASIGNIAKTRLDQVPIGYQRTAAARALEVYFSLIPS